MNFSSFAQEAKPQHASGVDGFTPAAVGLLSLSAVSLRVSSQGAAQAVARANARLALMIAIGELQGVQEDFHHPERKEWKILSASTVVLRPTRREICVFNNGTRIGNIEKHKILFPVM